MTVQAHVKDRILAGREAVFEAIVDPAQLAGFSSPTPPPRCAMKAYLQHGSNLQEGRTERAVH
jgi:hypothetical protein